MAKKETYGMKPVVNTDYGVGKRIVKRAVLSGQRNEIDRLSKTADEILSRHALDTEAGRAYSEIKAENQKLRRDTDASIGFLNLKKGIKVPKVKEDPAVEQYRRALLGKISEEQYRKGAQNVLKSRHKK